MSTENTTNWDFFQSKEFYNYLESQDVIDTPYHEWLEEVTAFRLEFEGSDKKLNQSELGFMPSATPRPWIPAQTPISRGGDYGYNTNAWSRLYDFVGQPDATASELVDTAVSAAKEQASRVTAGIVDSMINGVKKGLSYGDGGDDATTRENYSGGSNVNPTGLSLNTKPMDSSFTTDIVPLYRPKLYNDGLSSNTPLILQYGNAFPELDHSSSNPFNGSSRLKEYMESFLIDEWLVDISLSGRVKLNSFTKTLLNSEHVYNFLRITSYALSVYFFAASIVAHKLIPTNRNQGMTALYDAFTAEDLNRLNTLKLTLESTPIPPRVVEFMFHLYGNYKQSHLPGSPLVKLCPIEFENSVDQDFTTFKSGAISDAITMTKSDKFRDFLQLYTQAYTFDGTVIPGYTGLPLVDMDFNSLIANYPHIGYSDTVTEAYMPKAANDNVPIRCFIHTDAPDGWIVGASGIYGSVDEICGGFGGPKRLDGLIGTGTKFEGCYKTEGMFSTCVDGGNTVKSTTFVWKNSSFRSSSHSITRQEVVGHVYGRVRGLNAILQDQPYGTEQVVPNTIYDCITTTQEFASFIYSPPAVKNPRSSTRPRRDRSKRSKSEDSE